MNISERLATLYVSGGRQAIYETLTISWADETLYLVKAYKPVTARLETGEIVTFQPAAMDVALPAKNGDGTQDLKFAISNVNGEVSGNIQRALESGQRTRVTYREYIQDDLSAPSKRPMVLTVKPGEWTALQADIQAGYMNILNMAWPRKLTTPNDFPGVTYLT